MHPVYTHESANGGSKSDGSCFLRQIVAKFGASRGTEWDGPMYEGDKPREPTKTEGKYMTFLKNKPMKQADARKVLDKVDPNVRFQGRAEFVHYLAALVKLFPKEVKRKEAGGKSTIHQVLVRLAEPSKSEWLFNYSRQRQALSRKERELLALGTTSNEALHAELNRWFRTIHQMHQTTLDLKLIAFKLLKLLTHVSAQNNKTSSSMRQSLLAARVVSATDPWACDSVWEAFAASGPSVAEKEKAELLKAKLKQWVRTKPGAMKVMKKKAKAMKKRTVFTVPFAGTKIFYVKKGKAMK